jgi:flagellar basal-body rod protein FlgF
MDKLIYTDLAALRAAMSRQTAIAHNLANTVTPGFRADLAQARAIWLHGRVPDTRVLPSEAANAANMKAGAVTLTGRQLDIALGGDSLLAVQAPDGSEAYTRRGDLTISASGLLTTGDGYPVLGTQGPITLLNADATTIDAQGRITVVPAGGDTKQAQLVDQLKIVAPGGQPLAKAQSGLLVAVNGILPDDPDARVQSGALEGSNVQATEALVEMIEASRAWDNQLKLLNTARDLDTSTADLMKMPD